MRTNLNDYLRLVLQRSIAALEWSQRSAVGEEDDLREGRGVRFPATGSSATHRKRDQRTREALVKAGLVTLGESPWGLGDLSSRPRACRVMLTPAGAVRAAKAMGIEVPPQLMEAIKGATPLAPDVVGAKEIEIDASTIPVIPATGVDPSGEPIEGVASADILASTGGQE